MANRSHLYVLSADPKTAAPKTMRISGLSEWASTIPDAHRVFMSSNPYVRESWIFDGVLAIVADYEKGKERLLRLLDYLDASGEMDEPEAFSRAMAETKTFLGNTANQGPFVLLEAAEVYALYCDTQAEMEKENAYICSQLTAFGNDLDVLLEQRPVLSEMYEQPDFMPGGRYNWITELTTEWQDSFAIDWWSNVLYFSFSEPV